MTRDYTLYLSDIIENIEDARRFVSGMAYEQFVDDKKTINAVIRSIEVVGEAAKHIPQSIRDRQPEIPWKDMAGMRDKCIHDYVGIDCSVVWTAVHEELPGIQVKVKLLLETLRQMARK
jgi:uncharacterized protein with HEPN domain